MIDWWNSLTLAMQVFYCIAIPATLILVIQTILMFFGFGEDGDADGADLDVDADMDVDGAPDDLPGEGIFGENTVAEVDTEFDINGLRLFTLRGIVAFFVVFGWVGVAMLSAGVALWITALVSFVCGFAMMLALAFLMRAMMKLRNNGNLDLRNAVGTAGRVYLTIPPARSGSGKVEILLQGSLVEREAVTDETEAIPTGSEIVVISVSAGNTLVVRRK